MAARRNSFAALAPLDEDVEAISGIPPLAVVAAPTLAIDALAVGPLPSAGVAASSRAISNPDTVVLPPKSVSMTADLSLNRKFSEVDTTVDDAEDGFTKVVSRKFGMRRGVANEVDTQPPEDEPEMEIPWGVKFGGNLREIKKWSQQTATGRAVTRMGPGIITHGSYGADGHET